MKKLRISYSSFERSLNNFVSKRIFGIGENGENIRSDKGLPVCYRKVRSSDNTELSHMSMWLNTDAINDAKRKLLNAYKSKPFWDKSGFEIKSPDNWVYDEKMKTVPSPISRFYLTYIFENGCLYFKFFVRYKNGTKNRRIKQMKIELPKTIVETNVIPEVQDVSIEDSIRECFVLLSEKIDRSIVQQIFGILRKIDLSKANIDDLGHITVIFEGIDKLNTWENSHQYEDDLMSYTLHIIDGMNSSNESQTKRLLSSINGFVKKHSLISHHG